MKKPQTTVRPIPFGSRFGLKGSSRSLRVFRVTVKEILVFYSSGLA